MSNKTKQHGTRRHARELALQGLYALEFAGKSAITAVEEARAWASEPESADEDLAEAEGGGCCGGGGGGCGCSH